MVSSRFNGSQPQYVRKHTAATVENYEKKKIANAIGCLPIPNKILFEYIVKRAVFLLKAILLFYSYHILISKTNNKKFAFLLQEKKNARAKAWYWRWDLNNAWEKQMFGLRNPTDFLLRRKQIEFEHFGLIED